MSSGVQASCCKWAAVGDGDCRAAGSSVGKIMADVVKHKRINEESYNALLEKYPKGWSRTVFSTDALEKASDKICDQLEA